MPSFEEIFNLAIQLKQIEDIKINLRTSFNGALLVALYFESNDEEKEKKDEFFNRNKEIVDRLNKEIEIFNSKLETTFNYLPSKAIKVINIDDVKKAIYGHKGKDSTARKYTILKLNNCLVDNENSISNFIDSFDIQLMPFLGRNLPSEIYEANYDQIKEAFDVYSIGHFETAVFLMGKCLERNITDLLKKNISKGNINYPLEEINKWSLDQKINILKKENLISKIDHSKLMSIKWDRNTAGHPSKKEEIEKLRRESSGIITICISQIIDLQKKINETKSEHEIKEEKARKLLGGKSTWGGPTLYGSPQQKLEQLKGYSGELIDKLREEVKKEIEEEEKENSSKM